jgi:hypothetical protein
MCCRVQNATPLSPWAYWCFYTLFTLYPRHDAMPFAIYISANFFAQCRQPIRIRFMILSSIPQFWHGAVGQNTEALCFLHWDQIFYTSPPTDPRNICHFVIVFTTFARCGQPSHGRLVLFFRNHNYCTATELQNHDTMGFCHLHSQSRHAHCSATAPSQHLQFVVVERTYLTHGSWFNAR